jgi:MtN3 and saliva related transmembrane protein
MESPRFRRLILQVFLITPILLLAGCEQLVHDTQSLFLPRFQRSEIFGFVAGLGTTFAVLPDLIVMMRRKSSAGMNPRMAAIVGTFQILWVYYGLLIVSRPVVIWNVIGVLMNFTTVLAYRYFVKKERGAAELRSERA